MKRVGRYIRGVFWIALVAMTPKISDAQEAISPERVKAAFLYNFALYVEWPDSVSHDEFVIAVLGDPDTAAALNHITAGRSVRNQPVLVRTLTSLSGMGAPHILFLGRNANASFPQALKATQGKPVLLVGDASNALGQGAAINFALIDRRIRFEVSLASAQRAGLRVSSRLLGAAFRVDRVGFVGQPHLDLLQTSLDPFTDIESIAPALARHRRERSEHSDIRYKG